MNIRDIEVLFLAQFIDVLNVLEKFDNLQDLKQDISFRKDLYNKQIKEIETDKNMNCFRDYINKKLSSKHFEITQQSEYKELKKQFNSLSNQLALSEDKKQLLDELTGVIHELEGLENHLAFKLGLIEGIEIKEFFI